MDDRPKSLTGGCNCGAVRFILRRPPRQALYCHCKRCQRRSGAAASASAIVDAADVAFEDETHLRRWQPPDDGAAKVFCDVCGSQIMSVDDDVRAIRLGVFDDDPEVRPALRQWLASAACWEPVPDDGLPTHARGRDPGD